MMILQSGKMIGFLMLLTTVSFILYHIYRAEKGNPANIRKLAALEAIDELIGRAAEMGRPVHVTPGASAINHPSEAPQTFAGISVVNYIASSCAELNLPIIVTVGQAAVYPIVEEIVRTAYANEDNIFEPDYVRFIADAYSIAVQGILEREKPAANIMVGGFYNESVRFAEAGARAGALQVAGTARTYQIPFFVAACDYSLIGEEIFVAGAYISGDPVLIGSIAGQDLGKFLSIILILINGILTALGINWLHQLLGR